MLPFLDSQIQAVYQFLASSFGTRSSPSGCDDRDAFEQQILTAEDDIAVDIGQIVERLETGQLGGIELVRSTSSSGKDSGRACSG